MKQLQLELPFFDEFVYTISTIIHFSFNQVINITCKELFFYSSSGFHIFSGYIWHPFSLGELNHDYSSWMIFSGLGGYAYLLEPLWWIGMITSKCLSLAVFFRKWYIASHKFHLIVILSDCRGGC